MPFHGENNWIGRPVFSRDRQFKCWRQLTYIDQAPYQIFSVFVQNMATGVVSEMLNTSDRLVWDDVPLSVFADNAREQGF